MKNVGRPTALSLFVLFPGLLMVACGLSDSQTMQPTTPTKPPSTIVAEVVDTPVPCTDLAKGFEIPSGEWGDGEAQCPAITGAQSGWGVHTQCFNLQLIPDDKGNACGTLLCVEQDDSGRNVNAQFTITSIVDHQVIWRDKATSRVIKVVEQWRIVNQRTSSDCYVPRWGVKAR